MTARDPRILVVDLGTTSLRCSIVDARGQIRAWRQSALPAEVQSGTMAWDGDELARQVLAEVAPLATEWAPDGLAIANQRASALIWDASRGRVVGPVLSWSDNRSREVDRRLKAEGIRHVPGLSASKWRWLLDQPAARACAPADLRAGTLDSWLVWVLSGGASHVTDHVNASHTGLLDLGTLDWRHDLADALCFAGSLLPRPGPCTRRDLVAHAIPGRPPILAVIGDQQAALAGHRCDRPGMAKITFGTSAVLNLVVGDKPLAVSSRTAFGNVALSTEAGVRYGAEASIMAAGSSIEWLIRTGVLPEAAALDRLVRTDRRGEALFVSALDGLGFPHWQPRARGAFYGLSASDGPAEMARAVVDGLAAATADIVEGLESATGRRLVTLSMDGGLTRSRAFAEIVAATLQRDLRRFPHAEATTYGAARLAFTALGVEDAAGPRAEPVVVSADTIPADRPGWQDAVALVLELARRRRGRDAARTGGGDADQSISTQRQGDNA